MKTALKYALLLATLVACTNPVAPTASKFTNPPGRSDPSQVQPYAP